MSLPDYLLLLSVALLVFFAVRHIVRRKKSGKCIGCSCDCASCTHKKQPPKRP